MNFYFILRTILYFLLAAASLRTCDSRKVRIYRESRYNGSFGGTDLLHDLLLLDQERAHDTVLDAVRATGPTIGALDGLLGLRDLRVLAGAERGDLWSGVVSYSLGKYWAHLLLVPPLLSNSWVGVGREGPSKQSERTQIPRTPVCPTSLIPPPWKPTPNHELERESLTHPRKADTAVAALGRRTLLLNVKVTEMSTRGLDDADLVAAGVVPVGRNKRPSILYSAMS